MSMPSTSAVVMAAVPLVGWSVAKPRPRTRVLGRVIADRFGEVVDAGGEEQILALRQLGVDGGGGVVAGLRDVELAERNGAAGR